ncbi:dGTP triphosphohydrolase [Nocardiopsis sp. JB363]|uniref:dGTP triphosphohydrolase n=1 Tax=Nocardiopsis sp. JB363 TaxID=1434837 RepID=UPI00097A3FF6|nr:dNTP triphosphohydrolase [Nocardiopsis sp. JB363]SIO90788.1 Deoxyguanosinetriphosphate triphosphohydrolase [Nocardiopsis sp. JB363]
MNEHDLQRRHPAPESGGDPLGEDYALLTRSHALRALGGKSQSLGLHEGTTSPRSRLTHSLEVSLIAGRLAERLGAHGRLAQISGLAHDLGHPPFGHYGESVLNALAHEAGGFEANAQTLRILTRLEVTEAGVGLNPTRATVDAACKYPWPRQEGRRKFGVHPQDVEAFTWARQGVPAAHVRVEAQIMDWADDVANATGDFEDAVRAQLFCPRMLAAPEHRRFLSALAAQDLTEHPQELIDEAAQRLLGSAPLRELVGAGFDGSPSAERLVHTLTQALTTRWIRAATAHGDPVRGHHADLHVEAVAEAEAAWITAITLHHVLRPPQRRRHRPQAKAALEHLFEHLLTHPNGLSPRLGVKRDHASPTSLIRAVTDHIASMTEPQVNAWAREQGVW